MVEVTIGVASAIIAAGIAILQFILPNALALILTGRLSEDRSYTAVTWSVVSRFILSSHWPLILRSDANASKAVARDVSLLTWARPIGFLLIAVAAVVTPLGLSDQLGPSPEAIDVQFDYAVGSGIFSQLTTPRDTSLGPSRLCGTDWLCPEMPDLGNATLVGYWAHYNKSVPVKTPELSSHLVELYQSGLQNLHPSVSGPFDIQWRRYRTDTRSDVAGNASYLISQFRRLASVIQDDAHEIIEGLIVDAVSGGIGFRNHSVPHGVQYAAQWEEDILFMEPDVICVNQNITLNYQIPVAQVGRTFASAYQYWSYVDRGGFVNLPRTFPTYTNDSGVYLNGQEDPQLYRRAYNVAWATNRCQMLALNITSANSSTAPILSSLNQMFQTPKSDTLDFYDLDDGAIFRSDDKFTGATLIGTCTDEPMSPDSMVSAAERPKGGGNAEMGNIDVAIGSVTLAASESVDSSTGVESGNITFERPMYICAAATRMSIKTIKLVYNSTAAGDVLARLKVIEIQPRRRPANDEPLVWGQEAPKPAESLVRWNGILDPIWGLVNASASSAPNISVLGSETFYVPASSRDDSFYGMDGEFHNLAATIAPPAIWHEAFSSITSSQLGAIYSAESDLTLSNFYRQHSSNSTGVETILKLIWTDIAANALVGARGLHTRPIMNIKRQEGSDDDQPVLYPVYLYRRQLRYNWMYGIPLVMCLLLVGSALAIALVSMAFGQGGISKLRRYMFQVTAGRILATWTYPETRPASTAETKEWIEHAGHKDIDIFAHSTGIDGDQGRVSRKNPYVQVTQNEDGDPPIPMSEVWTR